MAAFSPRIHEAPDDLLGAIDFCFEQGWTDGLPVVPPAVDRVKAMLAADSRPPETVINRKSTRLNSSHTDISRMPSSA